MRDAALGCRHIAFAICLWRFDFWDGGSGYIFAARFSDCAG